MHDLCSLLSPIYATKYYFGYQIENNEMDGECSIYGGEERYIIGFGGET